MNFNTLTMLPSLLTLLKSLDTLSTAYRRAGLLVNTKKTEVLPSAANQDLSALSFSCHGDILSKAPTHAPETGARNSTPDSGACVTPSGAKFFTGTGFWSHIETVLFLCQKPE